jgi:hypothetical protein
MGDRERRRGVVEGKSGKKVFLTAVVYIRELKFYLKSPGVWVGIKEL